MAVWRRCLGWLLAAGCFGAASAARAEPVTLPNGARLEKVDFERHVQAVLSRQGCNAGACHGSLQGRGGLYLSLFGYSAEKDLLAFLKDAGGRRVNIVHPDQSLLLLKPTGQVPHGGDVRFSPTSWQHQVIRSWIAGGARWQPGHGQLVRLDVLPREHLFQQAGETRQLQVIGEFADGSKEDVTPLCDFKSHNDFLAPVTPEGLVRGVRPGETAILATYRGHTRAMRVLLPRPAVAGIVYPQVPEVNFIDRDVFAKLRKLNIVPSDLADDAAFLRRLTIDAIGSLPSPDEVRAFLADKDPDKRSKKIDELLTHPLRAALWATKLSDITGNNVDAMDAPANLRAKKAKMWHDWLRKRIADNMPYDRIVRGILLATSREDKAPLDWVKHATQLDQEAQKGFKSDYADRDTLDLFWRRGQGKTFFPIEQMAELTATAFLGVRIECAQCHKHPHDQWTQADYCAFANLFGQVQLGSSPEIQEAVRQAQAEQTRAATAAREAYARDKAAQKKLVEAAALKENDQRLQDARDKLKNDNADEDRIKLEMAKVEKDNAARLRKTLSDFEQTYALKNRPPQPATGGFIGGPRTEIFVSGKPIRQLNHPDTLTALPPKILGGPELDYRDDARKPFADWLVQPDNPFFARTFVNRVWAHYFGAGLVEPVDGFSAANPPLNESLLDALAKDFIDHKFDVRRLEKTILQSRVYQLSAVPNASNKDEKNLFSRSYPRRPMAEAVVDMLNAALGTTEDFGPDAPPGSRAIEVATNKLQSPTLTNVFRLFGRPARTATCDCQRAMDPALPQTLFLMTDEPLLAKMSKGRLAQLLASKKTDDEVVEELFLATLSRLPSAAEKNAALTHVNRAPSRQAGFVNTVWALINTREFILNH